MSLLAPRPSFPSVKFTNPGDAVSGTIAFEPTEAPVYVYGTKTPAPPWPDGKPKTQAVVTLNTTDGTVTLWAKGRVLSAIRKAVADSGAEDVAVGGKLSVEFTGYGEGKNPANPPKEYRASYAPPAGSSSDDQPPW